MDWRILAGTLALMTADLPALAQTPAEKGLEVAEAADAYDSGWGDSVAEVTMQLRDAHGQEAQRKLTIKTLEGTDEGDKSVILFHTPRDVRGTALLTYTYKRQPDDQWLYLPALKRVKRIATENQSGPFMGSEFAYEDLASQEVEKFTYRYLEKTDCPSLPAACHKIERTPVSEYSGYSRQHVWIEQDQYRIDRIVYFDRKGDPLKTLDNREFHQYLDHYWRPHSSLMTNHQTGRSTELVSHEIEFGTGLGEHDFNPSRLGRGR